MTDTDDAGATVGTDIVRIAQIDASLRRFGERFVRRVYTGREAQYCDSRGGRGRAASYAARFAAKEAVFKAMRTSALAFTEVEIVRDADGGPRVELHGRAVTRAAERGLAGFAVSLAHEDDYAVAIALGLPTGSRSAPSGQRRERVVPDRSGDEAERDCLVPLLEAQEAAFPRIREIYRIEERDQGRVRNLTRVTAHSAAAWQATTKALHLYGMLHKLDRPLVDLVCLYVSLLNGCQYCIDDAAGEALRSGWRPEQLTALAGPHTGAYTSATAAALRYAADLTRDPHAVDEATIEELHAHYDHEALVELTTVVGMKNFWNRFATGLRIPPEGKCADTGLMSDLLALSATIRTGEAA